MSLPTCVASSIQRAFTSLTYNQASKPDFDNEDYFNYTRGRFVIDEKHEMSQRSVRYDVRELAKIAAEAVGSRVCVSVEKYPDGAYNKALLMTMDDEKQVVAKVPNPNAGRPYFTTASEVATMEFARTVLETPVPKVFAWSSNAKDNTVGAEYIVMEKAAGIPLQQRWDGMTNQEQFAITKEIARCHRVWSSTIFPAFGSLYYREDLLSAGESLAYINSDGNEVTDSRFAIGPSVGKRFNRYGAQALDIDDGPWNTPEECEMAIGRRGAACVEKLPRLPKSPLALRGPGTYEPTRAKKLKAISCYLHLVDKLLTLDETIRTSHLWHTDLHLENIFVDAQDPTKLIAFIDWQSTELAPLYSHCQQPAFLDLKESCPDDIEQFRKQNNLHELDPVAKKAKCDLMLQQAPTVFYRSYCKKYIPRLHMAHQYRKSEAWNIIMAGHNILIEGEAAIMGELVDKEATWDELLTSIGRPASPFPFEFSDEEKAGYEADCNAYLRGMEAMDDVKNALGDLFPDKGVVPHEHYEDSLKALWQVRDQVIEAFANDPEKDRQAWLDHWPFDEWKPGIADADK